MITLKGLSRTNDIWWDWYSYGYIALKMIFLQYIIMYMFWCDMSVITLCYLLTDRNVKVNLSLAQVEVWLGSTVFISVRQIEIFTY